MGARTVFTGIGADELLNVPPYHLTDLLRRGRLWAAWDESGPHPQSFLGHLYALRVLFLHRHADHPEWCEYWAEELVIGWLAEHAR